MDEIVEGLFRIVVTVVRWFWWDLIFNIVLFNVGRLSLLLVTLGRYPRGYALEKDDEKISLIGIIVLALIWTGIAIYNNL